VSLYKQNPPKKALFLMFTLVLTSFLCISLVSALDVGFNDADKTASFNGITIQAIDNSLSQINKGIINPDIESQIIHSDNYEFTLLNADIRYEVIGNRLKETINLSDTPTDNQISFNIDLGDNSYFMDNNNEIIVTKDNMALGIFRKPYLSDGRELPYTFDGSTYTIDTSSINSYPAIIDPTYDIFDGAINLSKWTILTTGGGASETTSYIQTTSLTSLNDKGEIISNASIFIYPFYAKTSVELSSKYCSWGGSPVPSSAYLYFGSLTLASCYRIDGSDCSYSGNITLDCKVLSNCGSGNYYFDLLANPAGNIHPNCNGRDSSVQLGLINYTFYPITVSNFSTTGAGFYNNISANCTINDYNTPKLNDTLYWSISKNNVAIAGGIIYNATQNTAINLYNITLLNYNEQWTLSCWGNNFDNFTGFNLTSNPAYAYYFTPIEINNCSNNSGIGTNATALNISFFDTSNNSYIVNLTTTINYNGNTYYAFGNNITSTKYCVYPNYLNQSANFLVSYTDGTNVYQYYNPLSYFNNNTQYLNLYTQSGTATETFTIKDILTSKIISNVLVSQYRYINGIPILMEQKYNGIDGKINFNYVTNIHYLFVFSSSGYNIYNFDANPLNSPTYDINLIPSNSLNSTSDFGRTWVNINPPIYYAGTQDVNVTFNSPYKEYTSYSAIISYPTGTQTLSGSNSGGETLGTSITITNPSYFDQVYFNITYNTPLTGTVSKFYSFDIQSGVNNITMVLPTGKDPTHGMGIFERVLIVLGYVIITMGLCTLVGQELLGMGVSILIEFYFVAIGFLPIMLILPGLLIAMIIVSARSQ
jgi:hypothetical protein